MRFKGHCNIKQELNSILHTNYISHIQYSESIKYLFDKGLISSTWCPKSKFPLCFGCFLGFPCLYRGSFYHFSTAQETTISKLTLLSSLCQKLIKLLSKTWGKLNLDIIFLVHTRFIYIISKSRLPHVLLCNLINFWRREESKVSFGIHVSWAVVKW